MGKGNWLAVASAEHVRLGRASGFMQVCHGKAAVEAVTGASRKRRYDVVLMDMHMPVMDGLDAISAIRRHEEQHGMAAVPIMVLSADSQEKTRHAVLAHGASGFVTKPLDPDVLINLVEQRAAA